MRHPLRNRLRQLVVLIATVSLIGFTLYADALPLHGRHHLQVAQSLSIQFNPVLLTFSIWLPVFAGLIAYATYQLMPRQAGNGLHNRLALWLLVAAIGHCAWVYFWHLGQWQWALVGSVVQLEALMAIYVRLEIGRIRVRRNETLFVRLPFSLFLGWTSVIVTITLSAFLDTVVWDPFSLAAEQWLLIAITTLGVLIGFVAMRHRDFVLALSVIWGLAGIALQHRDNLAVTLAVLIMSIAMLLAVAAAPSERRPLSITQ